MRRVKRHVLQLKRVFEIRNRWAPKRSPPVRGYHMKKYLVRFVKSDSGATAIEYGLIAGVMAVAIIAAFGLFGGQLGVTFASIIEAMQGGGTQAADPPP